jgi:diaminopimelate epimerase
VNGRALHASTIDTGVPHVVIFVDGLPKIDVETLGRAIRFHSHFKPRGTNVDFVEQQNENFVELRTYERGVESETLGCGTGAVAAGLIGFLKAHPNIQTQKNAFMKVKTKSTEILQITFEFSHNKISNVWLEGSVQFVARGDYYLPHAEKIAGRRLHV